MKTVIFDVDGVLAEFTYRFLSFASAYFPCLPVSTANRKTWEFRSLTHEQFTKVFEQIRLGKFDWSLAPSLLNPLDIIAIDQLRQNGISIQYVTNREGPRAKIDTEKWQSDNRLPTGIVKVTADKAAYVRAIAADIVGIIDDAPSNLEAYAAAGFSDVLYVRDWPYNRDVALPGLKRVSSVAEFAYLVIEDVTKVDQETGKRIEVADPVEV